MRLLQSNLSTAATLGSDQIWPLATGRCSPQVTFNIYKYCWLSFKMAVRGRWPLVQVWLYCDNKVHVFMVSDCTKMASGVHAYSCCEHASARSSRHFFALGVPLKPDITNWTSHIKFGESINFCRHQQYHGPNPPLPCINMIKLSRFRESITCRIGEALPTYFFPYLLDGSPNSSPKYIH